jgi:hypothetical protein
MFSEPAIPVDVWYTLATLMPQGEYSYVDYQRWGPHPSEVGSPPFRNPANPQDSVRPVITHCPTPARLTKSFDSLI